MVARDVEKRKEFFQKISFGDVSGARRRTCNLKIFFNPPNYFVERCNSSNQNVHKNRTHGMSPYVRTFFQGGTKWLRRKLQKRKQLKRKRSRKANSPDVV